MGCLWHQPAATTELLGCCSVLAVVVLALVLVLDGSLSSGQAGDGHAQGRAGHVVHAHSGHKLDGLGVATVLTCKGGEREDRQGALSTGKPLGGRGSQCWSCPWPGRPAASKRHCKGHGRKDTYQAQCTAGLPHTGPPPSHPATHRRCRCAAWGWWPCRAAQRS